MGTPAPAAADLDRGKGRQGTPTLGASLADGLVFLLFLVVPLAASPAFWDQFTSVKWYALQALAAAWFLVELLLCGSRGWPVAVRRAWLPCLVLFLLPLPNVLRLGLDWAAPPLAERLTVIGLALAAYGYLRRTGGALGCVRAGVAIAAALNGVVGLAQAIGVQLLPALTAGDQQSALFGNVNMAAEYLAFAVLVLLVVETPPPSGAWFLAREVLLAFLAVELFLLASRSVFVALPAALLALVVTGRVPIRRLVALAVAAALGGSLLLRVGARMAPDRGESAEHFDAWQYKHESSSLRFAAWDSTLALVRDHPWGVGLGNFSDAFIPYQLEGSPQPDETLYFRSPHNEALRLVADGGIAALPLAVALVLALVYGLSRQPAVRRARTDGGALLVAGLVFYGVEACFQFPLDVAVGALGIALLTGLAAVALDPAAAAGAAPGPREGRWRGATWLVLGLLGAAFVAATAWRVARSEWLFVNRPRDLAAQTEACRLNPRNLPACVTAAWLQGRAGNADAARRTLTRVLERSPYYFPAIKLLGEQDLARGDRAAGCLSLWIYDEMFRRMSTVHRHLGRYCEPAQVQSFRATIPMPRYGRFPLVGPASVARSQD